MARHEETTKVLKDVVHFTASDSLPVRLASGLIGFRPPFKIALMPGQSADVDFKTKCSVPLLFNGVLFNAGENIVVKVSNPGNQPFTWEQSDIIARAYPLLAQDFTVA